MTRPLQNGDLSTSISMPYDPNSTLISTHGEPPLGDVVTRMLADLETAAAPAASTPPPSINLVSFEERSVGLGKMRGHETRGSLPLVSLKGGRLDVEVRFDLWGAEAADADAAVTLVQTNLLAARDTLRALYFLKIRPTATSTAERVPTGLLGDIWRKSASYRVLYEYRYQDTSGAESLIHRIPVHCDPEETESPDRETTVVTGSTVRWDNEQVTDLRLRGPARMTRLELLAYEPAAAPTGDVVLTRTYSGAIGVPATLPNLAQFWTAVGGEDSLQQHARVTVAFSDFRDAFDPPEDTADLGDWDLDGTADTYQMRRIELPAPIVLTRAIDRLEIVYEPAPFDHTAVVYLRVTPA